MTHFLYSHAPRRALPTPRRKQGDLPGRALPAFLGLTLVLSWGIAFAYIFAPDTMAALFGPMEGAHPLYFFMTWAPGLSGILLVMHFGGRHGLKAFFSRLLRARAGLGWWLLVLAGLPATFMVGSLIKGGPLLAPLENGLGQALVVSLVMLFLGPMEEFGWRGVAQPLLQRHMAPIWAGAVVGTVWAFWHLPAFSLSGTVYTEWNFPLFLTGCVAIAILMTPILNATRGGLVLPMLVHWQLILPIWPDAQPWDTWLLIAVTSAVVWIKRDTMFSRDTGRTGAVTQVIPQS
ncbi:MAG: CPBP family intramembrane metalloprotease [Maritimibacter sp.]|nr:CPBP family intramembrane metalloprotease [Maritimibacter sp.]